MLGSFFAGVPLLFLSGFIITNFLNPSYYFAIEYPHLPQVFILLSTGSLILVYFFSQQKSHFFKLPNVMLLLLYFCTVLTAFFRTVDPENSQEVLNIFSKGVFVYCLVVCVIFNYQQLRQLLYVLAACITINAIKIVHSPVWDKGRAWLEGSTLIKDPNDATMVFICGLPIVISLFLTTKNKLLKILLAYSVFVVLLAIIEARSRGGFLSIFAMFLVLLFIQTSIKKRLIIIAILAPVIFVVAVRYVPAAYFQRILEIVDIEEDSTGSAQARVNAMTISVRYLRSHLLSEYGPGNHSYHLASELGDDIQEISEDAKGSYLTHNFLLQYGHDNGLLPLLVYYVWLLSIFQMLFKSLKMTRIAGDRDMEILISSSLVLYCGFLVGALFLPFAYRLFVFYFSSLSYATCKIANMRSDELKTD